jgi:hypothetical protein
LTEPKATAIYIDGHSYAIPIHLPYYDSNNSKQRFLLSRALEKNFATLKKTSIFAPRKKQTQS